MQEIKQRRQWNVWKMLVRSSQHTLKYTNQDKRDSLATLRHKYTTLVKEMVNDIWDNGLEFRYKGKLRQFDISRNQLELPTSASKEFYNKFSNDLSARMRNQASTQAVGIIRSTVEKQRKRIHTLKKLQRASGKANVFQPLDGSTNTEFNKRSKPSCLTPSKHCDIVYLR